MKKIVAGVLVVAIVVILIVPWIPPITHLKMLVFGVSLVGLVVTYLLILSVQRFHRDAKNKWESGICLIEFLIALSIIIILALLMFQTKVG